MSIPGKNHVLCFPGILAGGKNQGLTIKQRVGVNHPLWKQKQDLYYP